MSIPVRNRRGFSLTELLVVLAIMALITRMSFPRIAALRDKNAVRAAKMQMTSYIATARAAAIRRSQPAQFYAVNNSAWATVGASGSRTSVTGTVRLSSRLVSVTPTNDSILFDARG